MPSTRLTNFDCLKVYPIYRVFNAAKRANKRAICKSAIYSGRITEHQFWKLASKFLRLNRGKRECGRRRRRRFCRMLHLKRYAKCLRLSDAGNTLTPLLFHLLKWSPLCTFFNFFFLFTFSHGMVYIYVLFLRQIEFDFRMQLVSRAGEKSREKWKGTKEKRIISEEKSNGIRLFPYPTSIIVNHLKKCNMHRHTAGTVQIELAQVFRSTEEWEKKKKTRIDWQQRPCESLRQYQDMDPFCLCAVAAAAATYNNTLCVLSPQHQKKPIEWPKRFTELNGMPQPLYAADWK